MGGGGGCRQGVTQQEREWKVYKKWKKRMWEVGEIWKITQHCILFKNNINKKKLEFCSGISTEWLFVYWFQIEFENVGFCVLAFAIEKGKEVRAKKCGAGTRIKKKRYRSNQEPGFIRRGMGSGKFACPVPSPLPPIIHSLVTVSFFSVYFYH